MKNWFLRKMILAGLVLLLVAVAAPAETQDFNGPDAGTVVSGNDTGGSIVPGTLFPGFTLSVQNDGNGPHTIIIFDSADPTGGDPDLGTPNQSCGGPGVGWGGQAGEPGENCVARGNLIIIAEDVVDSNGDGLVDDPDDEAGGGLVTFAFNELVDLESIVVIDIDTNESVDYQVYLEGSLVGSGSGQNLGNNSVQTLDLSAHEGIDTLEIVFSGSGAIAELSWSESQTAVEHIGLSRLKSQY